jgi:hypothetical protein
MATYLIQGNQAEVVRPRLVKKPETIAEINAATEERAQQQRKLIDAFKKANPDVPVSKMFAELSEQHPDVFSDPDDDDEPEQVTKAMNMPSDEKRRLDAKREVISHFQGAFPELPVDEVYHRLSRLNPEFFED